MAKPPSRALLEIAALKVVFGEPPNATPAVRGIDLTVERKESVALVGESGSGKSVTALSVLKLLPYPLARHPAGTIRFDGEEILGAPEPVLERIRGGRIGIVFQEPMTSLNPLHTIEKQISEALRLHQTVSRRAARARTLELLELVGIRQAADRLGAYPHQLSGGQRQRVMIAMALANEPELLIADEPTTALDVTIQAQILTLLRELRERLGMALLLITHDLGIVRKMADRVYVMCDGAIVESEPTEQLFDAPAHPYTRHLLAAEPKGAAVEARPDAPVIVRAEDIQVWFPIKRGVLRRTADHIKAVDGVRIQVKEGHTLGIVGESGSGKTTLGLALLGLESHSGSVQFDGRTLDALRSKALRALRKEMQIVFQDPYGSLSPRMSVAQIVGEGLLVHDLARTAAERDALIVDALAEVGLDPETRHRYPHEFSGGQRQRIAIARAMVLKPRLIILDEPTSALDMSVQAQIVDLLRDLQRRHRLTYIFISHDLKVIRALSHDVIVMRNGVIVEQGTVDRIFERPEDPYTRTLVSAAFDLEASALEEGEPRA